MTAIYIIDHTDPANGSFSINPNKYNGPGAVSQNTNLRLYGAGSLQYGEGVNENFLRILENFASPEATGGSPVAGLGVPDSTYFDPTKAVKGQLWFNSSTSKLMMYDGSNWASAGGTTYGTTAPPAPQSGDLWFDTSTSQLMIYDGGWVSVADRYVLKAGDTMTGILTLSGDPSNPLEAATKQYVDAQITANDEIGELTDVDVTGAANTNVLAYNAGTWEVYDIQADLTGKVDIAGDTMTGALTLSGDPTNTNHAANKNYVDGHAFIFTSTGADPGGTPKNGDIWIDTVAPKVYIRAASVWRQVWPAQFS